MEWIKLIGILIIIIGFILKFDTIAIILIAAVVTGLVPVWISLKYFQHLENLCRSTSCNFIYAYTSYGRFN